MSFNTGEVEYAAPAWRTSTASKRRSCFYPWERFTTERRKHDSVGNVLGGSVTHTPRLRARDHSSSALKGGACWPKKGKATANGRPKSAPRHASRRAPQRRQDRTAPPAPPRRTADAPAPPAPAAPAP